jgi:predicted nuclease of predicted toxin-antitoxin system
VRLLIDNDLSWRLARALRQAGHDAIHVADQGLDREPDAGVARSAGSEDRILLTRDGDFGPIVAASGRAKPSVIHLRTRDGRPSAGAALLIGLLPRIEPDLLAGALVTIDDTVVRITRLA